MNIAKKTILKTFRNLGYNIRKIHKEEKIFLSFDEIYKKIFKKKITIFDIGGNKGQSIDRFLKYFPNAKIYSFEPLKKEFIYLKEKYDGHKNIILNNIALGERKHKKKFYINAKSATSSFNKLKKGSDWLKLRSKENKTKLNSFTLKTEKIEITTLDDYCKSNRISKIDILKIDTQGYEDKILDGSKLILKRGGISAIECEIMFDNVYNRYLTFSDIEKNLIKNNYRFSGIETCNNNLFENILFFGDLLYIHKKILKKHIKNN